jgi:hypothetical protein
LSPRKHKSRGYKRRVSKNGMQKSDGEEIGKDKRIYEKIIKTLLASFL